MATTVTIRYFAAAADAAGTDEQTLTIESSLSVADLAARVGAEHGPELARVLGLCSFLLDGEVAEGGDVIPAAGPGSRVDVLPPFAGG